MNKINPTDISGTLATIEDLLKEATSSSNPDQQLKKVSSLVLNNNTFKLSNDDLIQNRNKINNIKSKIQKSFPNNRLSPAIIKKLDETLKQAHSNRNQHTKNSTTNSVETPSKSKPKTTASNNNSASSSSTQKASFSFVSNLSSSSANPTPSSSSSTPTPIVLKALSDIEDKLKFKNFEVEQKKQQLELLKKITESKKETIESLKATEGSHKLNIESLKQIEESNKQTVETLKAIEDSFKLTIKSLKQVEESNKQTVVKPTVQLNPSASTFNPRMENSAPPTTTASTAGLNTTNNTSLIFNNENFTPTKTTASTAPLFNNEKFTLTMKKPYNPIEFNSNKKLHVGSFDVNEPMGEQVFWLYPFWESECRDNPYFSHVSFSTYSLASAFGLSTDTYLKECKKIAVLKDCTNEMLAIFLHRNPNVQYLVVTGNQVTEFPDIEHGLKMLCVNECSSLKTLPKKFREIKTLHCKNCSDLEAIPEGYINLEVLDASHCYKLMRLPKLPKLKLLNCFDSTKLNLTYLTHYPNLEAVILNTKSQNCPTFYVPFKADYYMAPNAVKHMLYLFDGTLGGISLHVNTNKNNPLKKKKV